MVLYIKIFIEMCERLCMIQFPNFEKFQEKAYKVKKNSAPEKTLQKKRNFVIAYI